MKALTEAWGESGDTGFSLRRKLEEVKQELSEKQRELELLNSIIGILNRSSNYNELFEQTLQLLYEDYKFHFGAVFYAFDRAILKLEAFQGNVAEDLCDEIKHTAQKLYEADGLLVPCQTGKIRDFHCVFCLITGSGGKNGVLCLGWAYGKKTWKKPELIRRMLLIAHQLGMATGNIQLHEETRRKSITDALTGLYNRHYLNECIQKWRLLSRDNEPLSFILLDLNDFKHINDSYGHLTGDEILKIMAEIIRANIRRNDFAARYGGDEFIVVMPRTTTEIAETIHQRLWNAVMNWNHHPEAQRLLHGELLVFSAGIKTTTYRNIDLLLKQADREIYHEKEKVNQKMLQKMVAQAEQERQKYAVQAAFSLAKTVEVKDTYLRGHSSRVQEYAAMIAQAMGIVGPLFEDIKMAATLHDIGKIGLPLSILHKPEPLSEEELQLCRQHPVIGENIIKDLDVMENVAPMIRHHHERYDGLNQGKLSGYPDGLSREQIPIGARIIAVADSFDAMISSRPYRKSFEFASAIQEIHLESGKQFDPDVVKAFIRIMHKPESFLQPVDTQPVKVLNNPE
ncbi:MAG: HD domain-containing phosphohydrolase [Bacillota bacterium]